MTLKSLLAVAALLAAPAPQQLGNPVYLPPQARDLLHHRMERHGQQLALLVTSVVLLKNDAAAAFADIIVKDPTLSRSDPDLADLNSRLPSQFFDFQDQVRQQAQALSLAAKREDTVEVRKLMGNLIQTCIACHSVYLHPRQSSQ